MKKHLFAGLALLSAIISAPASATVTAGDTVTCGGATFECSTLSAPVGAGSEFGIDLGTFGTVFTADFSAGLLTLSFTNNPSFPEGISFEDGYALFFSNETNPFTFAALGDVTDVYNFSGEDVFGFDPSNITLDGGDLTINLANSFFAPGGSLQVKFDGTVTPPPAGAVPEPATWAMMILGFALVGFAMRRRTSATVQPLLA